jgi:hypothetical protein
MRTTSDHGRTPPEPQKDDEVPDHPPDEPPPVPRDDPPPPVTPGPYVVQEEKL